MELINHNIVILDFDETYYLQKGISELANKRISFQDLPHTNLYCDEHSLQAIDDSLPNQAGITFIGNGNYHYVSYLLLQRINVSFTLVLFDHHTDTADYKDSGIISCGSWVSYAIEHLPLLEKVIIIGSSDQKVDSAIKSNVHIFSKHDSIYDVNEILSAIQSEKIYISIDKDVLDPDAAKTNWDHGNLSLHTLCDLLSGISKEKHVIGLDICGELPLTPLDLMRKENKVALDKNEHANLSIINTLRSLS